MFKFYKAQSIISMLLLVHTISLIGILSDNFINRWAFQESCDFVFDTTDDFLSTKPGGSTFSPHQVKDGDTIFVRRVSLDNFFKDMHPKIKNKYILVTHVDDWPVPGPSYVSAQGYMRYLSDKKLIAWFGINSNVIAHPKFIPIPIGVFQYKPFCDDKVNLNKFFVQLRMSVPKDKLLYMNFSTWTNPERELVKNLFINKPFCHYVQPTKDFKSYMEEMAHFKFTLSPPGNGLDCYRTWEALLVGSIPIVKSSPLNALYKDLPVLIVHTWQEITESFLNLKYKEVCSRSYNLDKLYVEYWLKQVGAQRVKNRNTGNCKIF
jgi:hypothetical protein